MPEPKFRPEQIAKNVWIAPTASVFGDVELHEFSSIWYGAVLRGDTDRIVVGAESNVQDLCCLHADPGTPCIIGKRTTIGHAAVVHGSIVEDDCLIGMRAVVLNGARIGQFSIIGAGAVVTENQIIPPRSLVLGMPGKVIREVTESEIERIQYGSKRYVEVSAQYRLP